jgi:formylmethanofuran dehydrogenase subunit C
MAGLGNLQILGSVGDFAALEAKGYAQISIRDNAGHFLAAGSKAASHIAVGGSVENYSGYGMDGPECLIEIENSAAVGLGAEAKHGTIIVNKKEYHFGQSITPPANKKARLLSTSYRNITFFAVASPFSCNNVLNAS